MEIHEFHTLGQVTPRNQRQARNGVYTRMALLALVTGRI